MDGGGMDRVDVAARPAWRGWLDGSYLDRLTGRLSCMAQAMDRLGVILRVVQEKKLGNIPDGGLVDLLACEHLGTGQGGPDRPGAAWAGRCVQGMVVGTLWVAFDGRMVRRRTACSVGDLSRGLEAYSLRPGRYLSRQPPSQSLCDVLRLSPSFRPRNLAGVWIDDTVLVGADYPWPVDEGELAVLQAVVGQWRSFQTGRELGGREAAATLAGLRSLAVSAESYEPGGASHCLRIGRLAAALARGLGWSGWMAGALQRAAELHDIGKIGVSPEVLRAPRELSSVEHEEMRRHTGVGKAILEGLPGTAMAGLIAELHHESFDGTGYPYGLRGVQIPMHARIVKVADVYDALRQGRCYKPAYTHQQAVSVLRAGDDRVCPANFDPRVLEVFLAHHDVADRIWNAWGAGRASAVPATEGLRAVVDCAQKKAAGGSRQPVDRGCLG